MKTSIIENKDIIKAGVRLTYIDDANFQKWEVTDIFDGGFEAKDDFETRDFYFDELQAGWEISNLKELLYINKK